MRTNAEDLSGRRDFSRSPWHDSRYAACTSFYDNFLYGLTFCPSAVDNGYIGFRERFLQTERK